ncbi:MAG: presqualene diphosphate synthase HpnD [Deltaproteobacteria bacterium]|nr:presqualene diphosphate synthase HpnD [Deltaproteobacteria bacterium]
MPEGRPTAGVAAAAERPAEPWTHVHRVVARSGTSFLWGMRVLPAERRRAMYAIYAFCREVDDVADEPGDSAEKRRGLAAWREEIARLYAGEPRWLTTRALLQPVQRYDLPREEFLAVIDGVETDTAPAVRMGTLEDLLRYCRKVAGAVGMLSIHAFGVPRDPGYQIAETLGNAVQITNILRDVKEDAAEERLYVPLDLMERHGVPESPLSAVCDQPGFAAACAELAGIARDHYAGTERLLARLGRRQIRPIVLMMAVYRETLRRLEVRGWTHLERPVRLGKPRKLWLALRYGLL